MKLVLVLVRLPEQNKRWAETEAAREGLALSAFIRRHLLELQREREAA